MVLLLLPSSANKLSVKWQRRFPIMEKISKISMDGRHHLIQTYHANIMAKWEVPSGLCLLVMDEPEKTEEVDIPTWNDDQRPQMIHINPELVKNQRSQIPQLLDMHTEIFTNQLGRMT